MSENSISEEHVNSVISASKIKFFKSGKKTTTAIMVMPNGFEVVVSSSCVDPANYSLALGKKLCIEKCKSKVWEYEGYYLQSKMSEGKKRK